MTEKILNTHYVLDIKLEAVHQVETPANPGERGIGPKVSTQISELARFQIRGGNLSDLLDKGAKLLELTGE